MMRCRYCVQPAREGKSTCHYHYQYQRAYHQSPKQKAKRREAYLKVAPGAGQYKVLGGGRQRRDRPMSIDLEGDERSRYLELLKAKQIAITSKISG